MRRTPVASMYEPRVGPCELNRFIASSLRPGVPLVLTEPTVITFGSWPGELTVPKASAPLADLP